MKKDRNPKEHDEKVPQIPFTRIPPIAQYYKAYGKITRKDYDVLGAICLFLNNDPKSPDYNTCFPGRAKIAKFAGHKKIQNIDESITALEGIGLITKLKRKKANNPDQNDSNLYGVIFLNEYALKKEIAKLEGREAPADQQEPELIRSVLGNFGGRIDNDVIVLAEKRAKKNTLPSATNTKKSTR